MRYTAVAKQAPQLRILDSQVRDLRLQGAELWVPAQQLALHVRRLQSETLIGIERRLLQDQELRLLVCLSAMAGLKLASREFQWSGLWTTCKACAFDSSTSSVISS